MKTDMTHTSTEDMKYDNGLLNTNITEFNSLVLFTAAIQIWYLLKIAKVLLNGKY